jgi:hypothetical protein
MRSPGVAQQWALDLTKLLSKIPAPLRIGQPAMYNKHSVR